MLFPDFTSSPALVGVCILMVLLELLCMGRIVAKRSLSFVNGRWYSSGLSRAMMWLCGDGFRTGQDGVWNIAGFQRWLALALNSTSQSM